MKTRTTHHGSVLLACFTLFLFCPGFVPAGYSGTYYLQSLGGVDSSPPYPMDPDNGAYPVTEISPDQYLVEDSGGSMMVRSFSMMSADSIDPTDTNNVSDGSSSQQLPNVRNYTKYEAQGFALLNTNDLAAGADTNLYYACATMPTDTNTAATLVIERYGTNAVIIRADNFDDSQTNADFALLVCDKVQTATWKAIDFGGASDAQDGWLVQGSVPNWQVTGTMYMFVSNLNHSYNAFFKAIPYSGPQVAIVGTNQPYDTVSNIITLNTQILDLTGTTNEQFEVDVDGNPARYNLATNAVMLDTKYNPNDIHQVYLNVSGTPTPSNVTNPPSDLKVIYGGSTYIPLWFLNDAYLVYAPAIASPDVGTNFFLYSIDKPQNVAAIVTDPSNSNVVMAVTNYISTPGTVEVPWNFTEGDGVTPYSNDTYVITFIAFDPSTFISTNKIDRHGVRTAGESILTYQIEDPSTQNGPALNSAATTYIDNTIAPLYSSLYWNDAFSVPQYAVGDIGSGRDNPLGVFPYVMTPPTVQTWVNETCFAISNIAYSDFNYDMGHGNISFLGGGPHGSTFFTNYVPSELLAHYCEFPEHDWRMRKIAIWCCFSDGPGFHQISSAAPNWPETFGIRDTSDQTANPMYKNVALLFQGEFPQAGYSGTTTGTSVEVAANFDLTWIMGPIPAPGSADPTYSFAWTFNMMLGVSPEVQLGEPAWVGFGYLPYTANFDQQLLTNNVTGIHNR